MSIYALVSALQLGCIFGLVAMGVLISFRMLDFPDLTPDGSFPLGAASSAMFIVAGGDPWLALLVGTLCGAAAGIVTATLSERLRILNLLAGILTMTALYSVNIRIMARPNLPLLGETTVLDTLRGLGLTTPHAKLLLTSSAALLGAVLLSLFLVSRYGLSLRATGLNARMASANGINSSNRIFVGLAIANALCGLAGAIFAQVYGFADVTMGIGTIIAGLAAVILGEAFVRRSAPVLSVFACLGGAIVYRLALAVALESDAIGLTTSDLNALTAGIVTLAFVLPLAVAKFRPRRAAVAPIDALAKVNK